MKTRTGERKCEEVETSERRVTRNISAAVGNKSLPTPKTSISSSASSKSSITQFHDEKPARPIGPDGSYYECEKCNKGRRLLCCESCPRIYHLKCLGLELIPEGQWRCPSRCDDFSKPIKYLLRDSASKESKPAAPKIKYISSASSPSKRN